MAKLSSILNPSLVITSAVLLFSVQVASVDGFGIHRCRPPVTWLHASPCKLFLSHDNEDIARENNGLLPSSPGFDGKGFAGYLVPYAATLLLSLAVTCFFIKFVLMDY
jgi:hypothetical protein